MDFEFWWLLAFPLFFGLGWLAARIDIKHVLSESRSLPESYFKGLNFLLNQQPDKAIEAFMEAAKVDTETVELHFALGGLFRRRGEVDRAIRLHQNLFDRADLGKEQKLAALFELAQDYLKAGLLDRAEQLFGELRQSHYAEAALRSLMEIYVLEKDWHKAIAAAQQGDMPQHSYQKEIAQFYCELAVTAGIRADYAAAREYLTEALQVDRRCARANILLGDFEMAKKRPDAAVQIWKQIESQNAAYLPMVAGKLLAGYRELGNFAEGLALLNSYLAKYGSLDMLDVVFQATLESQGAHAAYELVRTELGRSPTLQGLDKLLEAQLFEVPAERRQDIQLVKNMVHQHSQQLAMYRCGNCGFKARQFYWHCPACGGWETFSPRRSEDYET